MGGRLPTEAERAEIVDLYVSGLSHAKIAERFQVSARRIRNALQHEGVMSRPPGPRNVLTAEQKAEAERLYLKERLTQTQIGTILGVCQMTVSRLLRQRGVGIRDNTEMHVKHALWHEALDELTPEAAYWCGFLFTDGTVVARPGNQSDIVGLHIGTVDRGHLEKFRTFLGSTHRITDSPEATFTRNGKTYTGRPTSAFSVASNRLAERLRALGRYEGPLDPALASSRDFWRGAMDGDGCIGVSQGRARFELVGVRRLLDPFLGFLSANGVAGGMTIRPASAQAIHRVGTMGRFALSVITLLYQDAVPALDRKMAIAREIIPRG